MGVRNMILPEHLDERVAEKASRLAAANGARGLLRRTLRVVEDKLHFSVNVTCSQCPSRLRIWVCSKILKGKILGDVAVLGSSSELS
jgi:hypothetical protein